MATRKITDFFLYRFRYPLTNLALIIIVFLLLSLAFFVPGGLSDNEMRTVAESSMLSIEHITSLKPDALVQLPFHAVQRGTIELFGISTLGVKLPSLIFGFLSIGAMLGVLRVWFRRNVALITALIAATSGLFLLYAQSGSGGIMTIFWSSVVLFFAAMMAKPSKFRYGWLLGFVVSAALSLYTPMQLYLLIALFVTGLIHPHARYTILRQHKALLVLGAIVFLVLIAPLTAAIVFEPSFGLHLLGWNRILPPTEWVNHMVSYVQYYAVSNGSSLRPVYGLGIILLMLLGISRLFVATYTAKSYILTIWGLMVLPLILISELSKTPISYVVVMLFVGQGINYLVRSWYKMFPMNPYARVAALFPLSVLLFGLMISSADRFFYGFHYDPVVSSYYSRDIDLLTKSIQALPERSTVHLRVSPKQLDFYRAYASFTPRYDVRVDTDTMTESSEPKKGITFSQSQLPVSPTDIIVGSQSDDAARFYRYDS